MIELTPAAQNRLHDYFEELRRVLSSSASVEPADVERDIHDHIDAALVGYAAPVDAAELDDVLRKLGSPSQWLPIGESQYQGRSPFQQLSEWKRSLAEVGWHLARGPESYRLAYLSFFVLALGCLMACVTNHGEPLAIATPIAFIFSRAALSLFTPHRLTAGQKWLLYPALLTVYLGFVVIIVVLHIVARDPLMHFTNYRRGNISYAELNLANIALIGIAWLFAGLVSAIFPRAVQSVFYPFAGWFSRRVGICVAGIGLLALVLVGAYVLAVGLPGVISRLS